MKIMSYASALILCMSLSLVQCQSNLFKNELTREKAKEIIAKQYPQDDHGVFLSSLPNVAALYGIDITIYNQMENNGLIIFSKPSMFGSKNVMLTNKGKNFFIKKDRERLPDGIVVDIYYVKTAILKFGEITGIVNVSQNIAKVEYTVIIDDLTPFGQILGANPGVMNQTANFMLYDNGWRIAEDKN